MKALLCKIAALRLFSFDNCTIGEAASGMSSLAYFLAKYTADHFNTVIKPLVYLSMFYFFINARSSLADNYIALFFLLYCVTGIAYATAIFFDQGAAQLLSVLPVVLTLTATQPQIVKVAILCNPKWALVAFVIANAERYSGVWLITRCFSMLIFQKRWRAEDESSLSGRTGGGREEGDYGGDVEDWRGVEAEPWRGRGIAGLVSGGLEAEGNSR
ncbi:hypothetical protein ACLB2K_066764 [Fragaria x ananassa]